MSYRVDEVGWLWVALAAVPMAALGLWAFAGMGAARRWSAVVVRAGLVGLIALLLAGLGSVRTTNRLAVVAVVDASGSVRRFGGGVDGSGRAVDAMSRARAFLQAASAGRGPEDLLGVVVFDGRALALATPTRGDALQRDLDVRLAEGTDIGAALRLARAIVPPDAAGRIVLISDGNETAGDALGAASESAGGTGRRFEASAVPIDVVPMSYRVADEVMVESVDAPPSASTGATVRVRVVLSSTSGSRGVLRLFRGEEAVDINGPEGGSARAVELSPGLNVVTAEVPLDNGRVHRFRAVYEPDAEVGADGVSRLMGDTVVENNQGESFTLTPGVGSVLVVGGPADGGESVLARALVGAGVSVERVPTTGVPEDLLTLQGYDLVILENVPADAVSDRQQEQLIAYARDLGGGIVKVGGPDAFGSGGWIGSPLERVLPVRLDLPDAVVTAEAAVVFILDNSGSMVQMVLGSARTQQEIANDAAALAIRSLDRRDLVGVIAFNSVAEEVVELGPNAEPRETMRRVRGIESGGGTNVVPALEMAFDRLRVVEAKNKQVIVLSDGATRDPRGRSPVEMARRMREAGITVSAIAVGDGADAAQMSAIARAGGGTFDQASNPEILPQLFMKAVRVVRTPMIREEAFVPVILPEGGTMLSGVVDPPALGGLNLTRARPEPTISVGMATAEGEPVLASWQVGLGQVVAFTSDASRWAEGWLEWPGFARLWTQVVRSASRAPATRTFQAMAESTAEGMKLRLDAVGEDGDPLDDLSVEASVFSPGGVQRTVRLSQVGPGVYEGVSAVGEAGSYVAVIKPTAPGRALPPILTGTTVLEGREFRTLSSNDELLRRIAERTGGRVLSLGDGVGAGLFDRDGLRPREAFTPLWRVLMFVAVGVLLLDIGTRRVAWDRWLPGVGGGVGGGVRAGVRDGGARLAALRQRKAEAGAGGGVAPVEGLGLSEAERGRLAAMARDRRRGVGAGQGVGQGGGPGGGTGSGAAAPIEVRPTGAEAEAGEGAGLMAAKRRAKKRFDDSGGGGGPKEG